MIFQSTLWSWLSKARPGNAREEAEDSLLRLPPQLYPCITAPFPFVKTLGSTQTLPAAESDVQGSFTATRLDVAGAALAIDPWIQFPPGVWDIDLEYHSRSAGAVSDLTCIGQLGLAIVDGGVTRNHLIAEVNGGQAVFQRLHRKFVVTVTKDISFKLTLNHTVGLGTCVNVNRCSLIATRLF